MPIPVDILRWPKPSSYPISVVPGDAFRLPVTIRNSSTGIPYDLTGCTCRVQIRATYSDANPVVDTTPPIDGTAAGGLHFEIAFTPTHTNAIPIPSDKVNQSPFAAGFYDVEITGDTGEVKTVMGGSISLIQQVTR